MFRRGIAAELEKHKQPKGWLWPAVIAVAVPAVIPIGGIAITPPTAPQLRAQSWLQSGPPPPDIFSVFAGSRIISEPQQHEEPIEGRSWIRDKVPPPDIFAVPSSSIAIPRPQHDYARAAQESGRRWLWDKAPPPDIFAIFSGSRALTPVQPQPEVATAILVGGVPPAPEIPPPEIPPLGIFVQPTVPSARPGSFILDKIPPPDIFSIFAGSVVVAHVQPQHDVTRPVLESGVPLAEFPPFGASAVIPADAPTRRPDSVFTDVVPPEELPFGASTIVAPGIPIRRPDSVLTSTVPPPEEPPFASSIVVRPGVPTRRPDSFVLDKVPPPDIRAIAAADIAITHLQPVLEAHPAFIQAGVPAVDVAVAPLIKLTLIAGRNPNLDLLVGQNPKLDGVTGEC